MQKLNNQTSMGNITKNVTYQAFIAGKVPKELAKSAAEETARNSRDFSDLKKSVAGLDESVTELRQEIKDSADQLRQEIKDSEAETRRELKEFLHKEIAGLESVLAAKIAEIHRDILKEILETRAAMAGNTRNKMAEIHRDILKEILENRAAMAWQENGGNTQRHPKGNLRNQSRHGRNEAQNNQHRRRG